MKIKKKIQRLNKTTVSIKYILQWKKTAFFIIQDFCQCNIIICNKNLLYRFV